MHYDRSVLAFHGCDEQLAQDLLSGRPLFKQSMNDYDWLGHGIYFWEYGADRAWRFAREQKARGKLQDPAVIGAIIRLGDCFDLLDTRFTHDLASAYEPCRKRMRAKRWPMPRNEGPMPDRKLRRLDCTVINWYLDVLQRETGKRYDTVRGGFVEGPRVFRGSAIHRETHIQISVRNERCILGVFRPIMIAL